MWMAISGYADRDKSLFPHTLGRIADPQADHEHPGEEDHSGSRCRYHSEPPCNQHSHCTANCRANFAHIESGNDSTVAALMSDSSGAQVFVKVGFQLWWVGISSRLPPSHAGEPAHTCRCNMTSRQGRIRRAGQLAIAGRLTTKAGSNRVTNASRVGMM